MNTTSDNQNLIDRLFAAGAHFGFTKSRRHPTVRPFIFTTKNGTDIFDLEKTATALTAAKEVLHEAGKDGKVLLCVGTKDEASRLVTDRALAADLPHVTTRWIGGLLTNFSEVKKRLARLAALRAEEESGELERKYTKKERVMLGREMDKLTYNFGGIATIERVPDMMLVVDPRHDSIAVAEARELGIPIVAIMSSDNDASKVTYPVVVNDALQASVTLVLDELIEAYTTGRSEYVPKPARTAPRGRTRTTA